LVLSIGKFSDGIALIAIHIYVGNDMARTYWFSCNHDDRYDLLGSAPSHICGNFSKCFSGAIFRRSRANNIGCDSPPTASNF
jgi:hypothetical protein